MRPRTLLASIASLTLLALSLMAAPVGAEEKRGDAPKKPEVWKLPTASSVRLDGHKHTHPNGITHLAFSPDGRHLATADTSVEGLIHIWDWTKRKLLRTIKSSWVRGLGFVDATTIVHTELTKPPTLLYHDITTGKLTAGIRLDYSPLGLAVSPDGKHVAIGEGVRRATGREQLRLYRGSKIVWSTTTGMASVGTVLFTRDGKHILVTNGVLYYPGKKPQTRARNTEFDAASGKRIRDIPGEQGLAVSPDGRLLAGWGELGASVWERATGRVRYDLPYASEIGYVGCAAFSREGRFLFAGGISTPRIAVFHLAKRTVVRQPKVDTKSCNCMVLSPDGGWLATAGRKRIRVWNLSKWLPKK